MSSSNVNQTVNAAETFVAYGLTFNVSDVDITAPKLNKSGGKSANLIYKPLKKSLMIDFQVPMLTWGVQLFKDEKGSKETYDMAIQFPNKEYSTPETDILLSKFQQLESFIKSEAIRNSMAWFNKKTMTPEVIDALWTPLLKYSKDKQTGEYDMTKSPTLKVKLPYYDEKFSCEIYDPTGNMLYPSETSTISPVELIPKLATPHVIIQCGGIWFANGKFGCTWRLFQAVVQPKTSMKGRCLIATVQPQAQPVQAQPVQAQQVQAQQQQAKQPLQNLRQASSQNETGLEIADDSDDEYNETMPEVQAPVQKAAPVVQAVQVPVQAPAAVQVPVQAVQVQAVQVPVVQAPAVVQVPVVQAVVQVPVVQAAVQAPAAKKKIVRKV